MFCSLFSDCLKALASPAGTIRWFSPFLCKGIRRQTGSLTLRGSRERERRQQRATECRFLQDFLSSLAWSLLALELCVPARCLNSCCATGVAQLLTHPQDQDHRAVSVSREGRSCVSWRLVVTNQGSSTRRCPCRWMLCSRRHLGCFSLSCCSSVRLAFRTAFCAAFPSHASPH